VAVSATRRTVRGAALKLPVLLRPCKNSRRNMAAEKTNSSTKPSKSEFIREQPLTMSAADVIAKGEAEGITLSTDLVYGVRSRARLKKATKVRSPAKTGKAKTKGETRTATPRKGAAVPRPIVTTSSAEELLRAVAAEIGLARAMEILAGARARVRALMRG